jgi:aconitate hydratase
VVRLTPRDSLGAARPLSVSGREYTIYALDAAAARFGAGVHLLPVSLKVLLENLMRHEDGAVVTLDDIAAVAEWATRSAGEGEVSFHPNRVLMPDSSGVPLLLDISAMRDAMAAIGADPARVNPLVPVDLVLDHSVMADVAGVPDALEQNLAIEYERNRERYTFVRWAEGAYRNLRVIPPGNGILHQINLEHLAHVVATAERDGRRVAFPDTLVGMDSHTPMINALAVFGWGVGGIEACAAMLGQPIPVVVPEVIGCRLVGAPREGVSATDIVLSLTQRLRRENVVGKVVEFCGPSLPALGVPDRATLANMAPEYGATMGFFPIDSETVHFLARTGRAPEQVALVEAYAKAQGMWREAGDPDPAFTAMVEFDLGAVEPCLAGPRRPEERVPLSQAPASFAAAFGAPARREEKEPTPRRLDHGDVVIAAITSCTNTSNPASMVAAGLLARNAVARGLRAKPWVKTSLSPGSRVVADYLGAAGLLEPLAALGFHVTGYGCMTCGGMGGPLPAEITEQIERDKLAVVAVLSGNRNFEARIHGAVRANYLAAPALVVAYALAGSIAIDLAQEPIAADEQGRPVSLAELWPSDEEVRRVVDKALSPDLFRERYAGFEGGARWESLPAAEGATFAWTDSAYLKRPPFLDGFGHDAAAPGDILGARPLLILGDGVTTDHISPGGTIPPDLPAGGYLRSLGIEPKDFNTYIGRRGNHEVMVRGTFANVRLRNEMVPGSEGGVTLHQPDAAVMPVYDAATRYAREGVKLVVIAGENYGNGSSRDWAAKGTRLLGVRAVIAESFERIHRSNLVGMGVLPLQFRAGEDRRAFALDGSERFDLIGLAELAPRSELRCRIHRADGTVHETTLRCRIDSRAELGWYRAGGILPFVAHQLRDGAVA